MIRNALDRNASASPEDVLAVKRALVGAGLYRIPKSDLTPFPDEAMFQGIEAVQRRIGQPRPDGIVRPGDKTAETLARMAADGAAAGGMVRVNAYKQDRGGHATPVSEHLRRPPGQGGDKGEKGNGAPPKGSPVGRMPEIRGCDGSYGCGHFGAGRKGANGALYKHVGVDIKTSPGETIHSPVSGTVVAPFDPYERSGDAQKQGKLSAIRIETNDGHVLDVLYVDTQSTGLKTGDRIETGQPIGTAQDLSKVYPQRPNGDRMTNHVDIRIRDKNGIYKDPTPLVRGQ